MGFGLRRIATAASIVPASGGADKSAVRVPADRGPRIYFNPTGDATLVRPASQTATFTRMMMAIAIIPPR